MIIGGDPDSPRGIRFDMVRAIYQSRSSGEGAIETLRGLMSTLAPYKDKTYERTLQRILDKRTRGEIGPDITFWAIMDAVIILMDTLNLWDNLPEKIVEGQELTQST